ncbi:MAG: glycerol-3-phosphate 1-O-acyltransferase PlsY [Candidatus Competibacterales bacterium]
MSILVLASILVIGASYALGSINSAIVVCRLMGLTDPRQYGSGNPGATNVLRQGGRRGQIAAATTLLGDILKGWLPVVAATGGGLPLGVVAGAGIAAFLGHLYPLFFGFRGGKGVATAFGVVAGLSPFTALLVVASWGLVFAITRVSALAALVAAALAPLYALGLGMPSILWGSLLAMVALVVWRHRTNIQRLRQGQEGRIGGS